MADLKDCRPRCVECGELSTGTRKTMRRKARNSRRMVTYHESVCDQHKEPPAEKESAA